MSATKDKKTLLKELLAAKTQVGSVQNPKTDLQSDALVADFEANLKELLEIEIKERLDNMPVRRTPGELVAMESGVETLKGKNRYYGMAKSIVKDGFYRYGQQKIRAHDLWLAHKVLSKANTVDQRHVGPSNDLSEVLKAMDTTTVGAGAELVLEENARFLWDDFFTASLVVSNLGLVVDPMPADPWPVPLGLGEVRWRKGGQNTAVSPQEPTTAESTLKTTEQVAEINWSYSLNEDAVVAFMPALRTRIAISGGEIMDAFFLNADSTYAATGNINLVDSTPEADSYFLSNGDDGLRHLWLVDNTNQGVNAGGNKLTDDDMGAVFAKMGKYALAPGSNLIIPDINTYLMGMRTLSSVITVDKFGAGATILTGQLATYMGAPIIPSASHLLGNSAGKISATAGNNTLGSMSVFHKGMWIGGFKRGLSVEVDRDIRKRELILVASFRMAQTAHGNRSSATHTAGIYNIGWS